MPEPDKNLGADVSGLGLGERLRSARKAKALSLEQVAESLRLDESVVLALEDGRYEAFGARVFVRGHLKAYARLVGLSIDGVLDAYSKTDPENEAVPVAARVIGEPAVAINPVTWGIWGVIAVVGLALAAYLMQGDPVTPASVTAPAAEPESPQTMPEFERPSSLESEEFMPEPADVDFAVPAVEPAVEPGVESQAQMVRLSLHFRQESWAEISDANRRLLYGLQRQGRRREFTGEPPIKVLLGNGVGVDLSVNDEPFPFRVARAGRVTRFEIAPDTVE